jgi:hypothetical protein
VSETDYFGAVHAAGDGEPSWAATQTAEPTDSEAVEPVQAAAEPAADEWEPLPPASLEERVAAVESWLGPRVAETERAEELGRMQAMAELAHEMPARELAEHAAAATEKAISDRLGLVQQPAGIEDVIAAADQIAAHHLGEEDWGRLREPVVEELMRHPQWLHSVQGNPDPATLASTYVTVAATMRAAEGARAQAVESKRWAETLSGGSSRPATQTADEQYWAAVRAADAGGYR